MLRQQNSKPYSCGQCTAGFFSISSLNSHLKIHSNIYGYRCTQCSFKTKLLSSLKKHMRIKRHNPELHFDFGRGPLAAEPVTAAEPCTSATLENLADQAAAETQNPVTTATLPSFDSALHVLARVAQQSSRLPTDEIKRRKSTPLNQPKVLTGPTTRKPVKKNTLASVQRQQKGPKQKAQTITASRVSVHPTKTIEAILHAAQSNQNPPYPLVEPVYTTENSSVDDKFADLMLLATEAAKAARLPVNEAEQSWAGVDVTPPRPIEKTTDKPPIRLQSAFPTGQWSPDTRLRQVQIGPVATAGRVRFLTTPVQKYSEAAAAAAAAAVRRAPRYRPSMYRDRVYAQRYLSPLQTLPKAVRSQYQLRQPTHYVPRPFYVCRQCEIETPGRFGYVPNVSNNNFYSEMLTCTQCGQPLTDLCSFSAQSAFEPDHA